MGVSVSSAMTLSLNSVVILVVIEVQDAKVATMTEAIALEAEW